MRENYPGGYLASQRKDAAISMHDQMSGLDSEWRTNEHDGTITNGDVTLFYEANTGLYIEAHVDDSALGMKAGQKYFLAAHGFEGSPEMAAADAYQALRDAAISPRELRIEMNDALSMAFR